MDGRDCVSSWNFVEPTPKCKASWTTTVGPTKRKAPSDDDFNVQDDTGSFDNFEPPLKQFAFDRSTLQTANVFKDDLMNRSLTTSTGIKSICPAGNTRLLVQQDGNFDLGSIQQTEDMEMEENESDNNKTKEDMEDKIQGNHLYSNNNLLKDGKNSGNLLQQQSSLMSTISQPFGSTQQQIVLSEEVIASMGQTRGPNEVSPSLFLPPSIMNQMYKNAMALVPYSGPPTDQLQRIVKAYENLPPKISSKSIVEEDQEDIDDDSIIEDEPPTNTKSFGKADSVSFCDSGGMDI